MLPAFRFNRRFISVARSVSDGNLMAAGGGPRPVQFHGGGLAALHRPAEDVARWRLKLSERLTKILMSSEKSRSQLLSKKLYIQLDQLNPQLLKFFYGDACAIPKNFQSWFAITQLHVWMCQTRLRTEGKTGQALHAGLVDHFTTDIEMKLWAAGISNVRVYDRHLHELLSFHYGCVLAYDEGYESNDSILASALWRNVYSMSETVKPHHLYNIVHYVRSQMDYLHNHLPVENLMEAKIELKLVK